MGVQGRLAPKAGDIEYYGRPLNNGDMALVVVNPANTTTSLKLPWADMHVPEGTAIRDLWKHEDFKATPEQTFTIPAHGSLMFRMKAPIH
jgi:alpha-galactosidase